MLNIYTMKKFIPKDKNVLINSVDERFISIVNNNLLNDGVIKNLIRKIDKSELIAPRILRSRFGDELSPTYLSSGCKAAILVYLSKPNECVNTVECGNNALIEILKLPKGNVYMPMYPITTENFKVNCTVFTLFNPEGVYCDDFDKFFYNMKGRQ